jgi:hypothetical protein
MTAIPQMTQIERLQALLRMSKGRGEEVFAWELHHIVNYVEREIMRSGNTNTAWARRSDSQSLRIIPCGGR